MSSVGDGFAERTLNSLTQPHRCACTRVKFPTPGQHPAAAGERGLPAVRGRERERALCPALDYRAAASTSQELAQCDVHVAEDVRREEPGGAEAEPRRLEPAGGAVDAVSRSDGLT